MAMTVATSEYENMKVTELRAELMRRGLSQAGARDQLVKRLEEHDKLSTAGLVASVVDEGWSTQDDIAVTTAASPAEPALAVTTPAVQQAETITIGTSQATHIVDDGGDLASTFFAAVDAVQAAGNDKEAAVVGDTVVFCDELGKEEICGDEDTEPESNPDTEPDADLLGALQNAFKQAYGEDATSNVEGSVAGAELQKTEDALQNTQCAAVNPEAQADRADDEVLEPSDMAAPVGSPQAFSDDDRPQPAEQDHAVEDVDSDMPLGEGGSCWDTYPEDGMAPVVGADVFDVEESEPEDPAFGRTRESSRSLRDIAPDLRHRADAGIPSIPSFRIPSIRGPRPAKASKSIPNFFMPTPAAPAARETRPAAPASEPSCRAAEEGASLEDVPSADAYACATSPLVLLRAYAEQGKAVLVLKEQVVFEDDAVQYPSRTLMPVKQGSKSKIAAEELTSPLVNLVSLWLLTTLRHRYAELATPKLCRELGATRVEPPAAAAALLDYLLGKRDDCALLLRPSKLSKVPAPEAFRFKTIPATHRRPAVEPEMLRRMPGKQDADAVEETFDGREASCASSRRDSASGSNNPARSTSPSSTAQSKLSKEKKKRARSGDSKSEGSSPKKTRKQSSKGKAGTAKKPKSKQDRAEKKSKKKRGASSSSVSAAGSGSKRKGKEKTKKPGTTKAARLENDSASASEEQKKKNAKAKGTPKKKKGCEASSKKATAKTTPKNKKTNAKTTPRKKGGASPNKQEKTKMLRKKKSGASTGKANVEGDNDRDKDCETEEGEEDMVADQLQGENGRQAALDNGALEKEMRARALAMVEKRRREEALRVNQVPNEGKSSLATETVFEVLPGAPESSATTASQPVAAEQQDNQGATPAEPSADAVVAEVSEDELEDDSAVAPSLVGGAQSSSEESEDEEGIPVAGPDAEQTYFGQDEFEPFAEQSSRQLGQPLESGTQEAVSASTVAAGSQGRHVVSACASGGATSSTATDPERHAVQRGVDRATVSELVPRARRAAQSLADLRQIEFEESALTRLAEDLQKQLEKANWDYAAAVQEGWRRRAAYEVALKAAQRRLCEQTRQGSLGEPPGNGRQPTGPAAPLQEDPLAWWFSAAPARRQIISSTAAAKTGDASGGSAGGGGVVADVQNAGAAPRA